MPHSRNAPPEGESKTIVNVATVPKRFPFRCPSGIPAKDRFGNVIFAVSFFTNVADSQLRFVKDRGARDQPITV